MIKSGEKTIIRNLLREDIDKMLFWGKHDNPLFFHYNFPKLTRDERDIWYKIKTKKFKKKCFAIENSQGNLIGYISLRDIKLFKRESELGIVLDPDYIGQGYGTDALKTFLDLYFNGMKMKTLYLRVAKFNKRAKRCYEKCGFEIVDEFFEEFEEQNINCSIKENIVQNYGDFKMIDGKLYVKYYYMKITNKKYLIHKK